MKSILPMPGAWGVNEQEQDQLLNPAWATIADGLVLNDSGRLACRGGLVLTSTDGAPAEILRQFVYVTSAGVETVISSTATKIISGVGDLDDASTDITPTGAPTNGYWQFQNFNGKVVGWQAAHTPIVWSGSGDFATITATSGTLPDGDSVVAAFGRLWAVDDDGQTVRYCALLDETLWATADGGGSIDLRNVWTKGMDRVTALAAFGSNLIVFGRRHIIVYTDGSGSALGVDPAQMYVVDTVEGTGCVARDSVASVGEGDLVFLSEAGLQTLGRVIQSKDNPLDTISWQINDRITTAIKTEVVSASDLRTWTGAYIPLLKQYMLVHTTTEDVFVFHTDARTQDDKGRQVMPVTIWDTSILTNIRGFISLRSGVTYTTGSATHEIYQYDITQETDASSALIAVDFESGWIDFQDPQLKLLKLIETTVLNPGGRNSSMTLKYGADYTDALSSIVYRSRDESRIINLYDTMGEGIEGQYFKIGFEDPDFGLKSFQHVVAHYKSGRTGFIHKNFSDAVNQAAVTASRLLNPNQLEVEVAMAASATSGSFTIPIPSGATGAVLMYAKNGATTTRTLSTLTVGGRTASFLAQQKVVPISEFLHLGEVVIATWSGAPTANTISFTISGTFGSSSGSMIFQVYFLSGMSSYIVTPDEVVSALVDLTIDSTPSVVSIAASLAHGIVVVCAGRFGDYSEANDRDIILALPENPAAVYTIFNSITYGQQLALFLDQSAVALGALSAAFSMPNATVGSGGVVLIYEPG